MTIDLRGYQEDVVTNVYSEWNSGIQNVGAILPTGSGKTIIFSHIVSQHRGACCVIAHRQELVLQISMALAAFGVRHSIVGPKDIVKLCVAAHMETYGRTLYDCHAPVAVAGVDTLIKRKGPLAKWCNQVTLWVQDEVHHLLAENKWGTAVRMFPNARGLGVTATPCRADGKGLGRHADGLLDTLVEGPAMGALIAAGFLADYRIFAPPNDLDLSTVGISQATGDFKPAELKVSVRKSHIVGDIVKHYNRIAAGKQGITFVTDIETATDVANQFNHAGVRAAAVSSKTGNRERGILLKQFRNREIQMLVNVDLFGEGFDVPGVEVCQFARPTESFAVYSQQFGRPLRPFGDKKAIIIDHVGNVARHGLPDTPKIWTLDRRERGRKAVKDPYLIPTRTCLECTAVYERIHKACPYCGAPFVPAGRSHPDFVDGDLLEVDLAGIRALQRDIDGINLPPDVIRNRVAHTGAGHIAAAGAANRHAEKQAAQVSLRESIAWWAGYMRSQGKHDSESYRRFFFRFGIDVMSAQALNRKDAEELKVRVDKHINEMEEVYNGPPKNIENTDRQDRTG